MPFLALDVRQSLSRAILPPTKSVIVSWNAPGQVEIDIRIFTCEGQASAWLPYVRPDPLRSCSGEDAIARIETDTLVASKPFELCEIRTKGVDALFFATPWQTPLVSPMVRALTRMALPVALTMPMKSQYIGNERGWCSAASLAMLLGYWSQRNNVSAWDCDVAKVAGQIFDPEYGGTGNWTFATAYASRLSLRGVVAYLVNLDHAHGLLSAGIPLAAAIAWEEGELEGAPLPRSDGHLLVIRGFDDAGDVLVYDPAHDRIAVRYKRIQFERQWLNAGGVVYCVAPPSYDTDLLTLLAHP